MLAEYVGPKCAQGFELRLRGLQEAADTEVVECSPRQSSEQGRHYWNPPHSGSIGDAVILESGDYGKKARAKVPCGVNGVSVHPAEAHADGDHDQPDHQGSKVRTGRHIELIRNGEDKKNQQGSSDQLIEKSGLGHGRKRWEGSEHAGGVLELGIGL